MQDLRLTVVIMSGVSDGKVYEFTPDADGAIRDDAWTITIGRKEINDLCLNRDTYVSRVHAALLWRSNQWQLEDKNSTNGTFIENETDFFGDTRVYGIIPIEFDQLFRLGRTWLRIQAT